MNALTHRPLPIVALVASLVLLALVVVVAAVLRSLRVDDDNFAVVYLAVATPWVLLLGRWFGRARPDIGAGQWFLFSLALSPMLWASYLCGSRVAHRGLGGLSTVLQRLDQPESLMGALFAFFFTMAAWRLLGDESWRARVRARDLMRGRD